MTQNVIDYQLIKSISVPCILRAGNPLYD